MKLFAGRYTTSDMIPLPASIFTLIYVVYLAVYGAAISHLDVWQSCSGPGVHYKVTTAGLIAVFALSALLQAGMMYYGFQGTVFELSRRKPVVYLLYVQTVVWIAQAIIMIYGTVILYLDSVKPTCWKTQRRAREGLTHAMIWSTWAQVIFLLLVVYIVYNSYQGKNIKAWEARLKALARWLCCGEHVNTPMAKK